MNEQKVVGGRVFEEVGREPYTRKDGRQTEIRVWSSGCAKCGATFFVKTPANLTGSKAFGRKHCDAHKGAPFYKRA